MVFTTPLLQFGSYFENNSRFDNATVNFYAVNDQLIGSVVATDPRSVQAWTWNGWQSDVPIHRLVITGNDTAFFNGFIWFDDVQTIAVPEPSSIALLVMAGTGSVALAGCSRRSLTPVDFAFVTTNTTYLEVIKKAGHPD